MHRRVQASEPSRVRDNVGMLILHLSDLHFGAHSRFQGRDAEEAAGGTLDELCDRHDLPRLPLLEGMPDELEVDWEKEARED